MFGVAWIWVENDSEDGRECLGLFIRSAQENWEENLQESVHQTLELDYQLLNTDPNKSCRSEKALTHSFLAQRMLTEPFSPNFCRSSHIRDLGPGDRAG